jgi:protein gp37
MSDLFHDKVPDDYVQRVFDTMRRAHWHEFQLLTKRPERAAALGDQLDWPENVWFGVSVESKKYFRRIDSLRSTAAALKFLSLEPLLGPLSGIDLSGIDWVIVGGESGHGARPMSPEWVAEIRDACVECGVPFFFKQWGAHGPDGVRRAKKENGRLLEGRTWDEWPDTNSAVR